MHFLNSLKNAHALAILCMSIALCVSGCESPVALTEQDSNSEPIELNAASIAKREIDLPKMSIRPGDLIDVCEIRKSAKHLETSHIFAGGDPNSPGQPPRIVVRPPDLDEISRMAQRTDVGSSSYGSQSSGEAESRNRY